MFSLVIGLNLTSHKANLGCCAPMSMDLPLKDVVKFSRCGVFSVFFSVEIDFDGGGKKCLLPEAEAPACLLFVPPSRVDKNVRYKH